MIDFARGSKCGIPSGGVHPRASAARRLPSRPSMAPSAMPVKPKPTSARNVRRRILPQQGALGLTGSLRDIASPSSEEVVVVEEGLHEVLPRPARGIVPGCSLAAQERRLAGEELEREPLLLGGWSP